MKIASNISPELKSPVKKCLKCGEVLDNNRKKFCNSHCQYWYNSIKKDNESHLAPFKKRNKNFFSMITGYHSSVSSRGQGKRSGKMVRGSMAAYVNITNEEWAEVTYENIKRHFTCISFYRPSGIRLGDETWIKEEDIMQELGIRIDF